MTKEQRVFKNNGKRFEEDFRASFGEHVWTFRPPDTGGGMMARFTQESLADLMAYNIQTKNFALFELKSTLGTSVNFRPYEQCMTYEKHQLAFDNWNANQDADSRRLIREEIREHKSWLKGLYRDTNQAMIKYHQIRDLLQIKNKYNIDTYLAFTFFRTTNTYVITVESFIENFWKLTEKKSINENDLNDLVSRNLALNIEQQYIRRTMKSTYNVNNLI